MRLKAYKRDTPDIRQHQRPLSEQCNSSSIEANIVFIEKHSHRSTALALNNTNSKPAISAQPPHTPTWTLLKTSVRLDKSKVADFNSKEPFSGCRSWRTNRTQTNIKLSSNSYWSQTEFNIIQFHIELCNLSCVNESALNSTQFRLPRFTSKLYTSNLNEAENISVKLVPYSFILTSRAVSIFGGFCHLSPLYLSQISTEISRRFFRTSLVLVFWVLRLPL